MSTGGLAPMKWEKLGVVWCPDGSSSWARSHATCPTPLVLGDRVRVYVQCRDAGNVGRIGYVDVDARDPTRVLNVHPDPVLDIGEPGTFDENGAFQTCVLPLPDGRMLLYYVGFELGTKIRYRMLTGLAESRDGGVTFARVQRTPILERSDEELLFRCGPFVLHQGGRFRMWYIGGSGWMDVDRKAIPVYSLRHAESDDGATWPRSGRVCMEPANEDEIGFGRPYVVPAEHGFEMFYSTRRRSLGGRYVLGYARSPDGIAWTRRDDLLNLATSASGWDSENVEYPAVLDSGGQRYLFYNGNDFGRTGFGVARLTP